MRRHLIMLSLLGPTWAGAAHAQTSRDMERADPSAVEGHERRVALVIGVDDYQDPMIPDLAFTDDDVRGVSALLIESGSFRRQDVIQMLPGDPDPDLLPTRANILTQIARLRGQKNINTILVYYSGHGSASGAGSRRENYIFPMDTRLEVLEGTGLRVAELVEQVEAVGAKSHIIVFDACRNAPNQKGGGVSSGFQDERYSMAEGTSILFGARFGEPAYEEPDLQHGAFTAALLEGLRGSADGWQNAGPADRVISLQEAYLYAADRLLEMPREGGPQKPYLAGESYGDPALVLLRSGSTTVVCPSRAEDLEEAQTLAMTSCSSPERFRLRVQVAEAMMACLSEPLTPAMAIRAHQLEAIEAMGLLDRASAARAWRAATQAGQRAGLRLEVPEECVPPLPVRQEAEGLPVSARPLPSPPPHGVVLLDGARADSLQEGIPAYLQVRWNPSSAEPPERVLLSSDKAATPTPIFTDRIEPAEPGAARRMASNRILIGAGAAAALSCGLAVGALNMRATWDEEWSAAEREAPDESDEERDQRAAILEAQRTRTNALWMGGQASGAVALGLAVVSFTVRF